MQVTFDNLLLLVQKYIVDENQITKIKVAYELANQAHENQYRISGEKYITHPLYVAIELAKIQVNSDTICAALLHDTLEDTNLKIDTIENMINVKVAHLVESLSNPIDGEILSEVSKQINNIYSNYESVIIKLYDRLHNMKTLSAMNPIKQIKKAKETLNYYVPIAHALGLTKIRMQLEDLSFMYLDSQKYTEIKEKTTKVIKENEEEFKIILDKFSAALDNYQINHKLEYRAKNIYSIYRKMKYKNQPVTKIQDLLAIRIITNDHLDCYKALGVIHKTIAPLPGKIKDYISLPKSNNYQAIHTRFRLASNLVIEAQIKTQKMHLTSEQGIAAHYNYKIDKYYNTNKLSAQQFNWINKLKLQFETERAQLKYFRKDVSGKDKLLIFSSNDEFYYLPINSTALDFAFLVHEDLGLHAKTATINGQRQSIKTTLKNGDLIKINTQSTISCDQSWLEVVKTEYAKLIINNYLIKQNNAEDCKTGKQIIKWIMKKNKLEVTDNLLNNIEKYLYSEYQTESIEEMYINIAKLVYSENEIENKIVIFLQKIK